MAALLLTSCARTNSWYETASLTKRRPLPPTAIRPGFALSVTVCGKTPWLPSRRVKVEAGTQKAPCSVGVVKLAPTSTASRAPRAAVPGSTVAVRTPAFVGT